MTFILITLHNVHYRRLDTKSTYSLDLLVSSHWPVVAQLAVPVISWWVLEAFLY